MEKYLQYRKEVITCCRWLCRHGYFGSLLSAGGNVSGGPGGTSINL